MRNAEFDKEKVLRAAMVAFMGKGYSKTSMQDLTKATGLHPGSIYCAFENKRGLLLAALEQYQKDRNTEFNRIFTKDKSFLVALREYLDNVLAECISCDVAKACLLTKALSEIAEQDDELQNLISENLNQWQLSLTTQFEQGKLAKEFKTSKDSAHLARFFVMGIYGLRTFAQTHPDKAVLSQLADQLYQDILA